MDKYAEIIEALKRLKFAFPVDNNDNVWNRAIDAAIHMVNVKAEQEGAAIAEAFHATT